MSACGQFADHLWKPGSCKNCFHPSSAHPPSGGLAPGKARADADEDANLGLSTSYSKPTIAVRPTVMNPDNLDMLADVNMNTEQDNQKYVIDRLSLMEMLELSPFYRGKNGCSKTLREVVMQNAAGGKTDYLCRFSCGTVSSSNLKPESLFSSSLQGDGQGPLGLREGGVSGGFWPRVTDPVKSHMRVLVPEPERTAPSSGSCEGRRGAVSEGETLAVTVDNMTTAPNSPVKSRGTERPDASDGFPPGCVGQGSPEHSCTHRSSPAELISMPNPCSCPRCEDSSLRLKAQNWPEKPQPLLLLPSPPSNDGSPALSSEPIYAESTKRKKKACVKSPSQQRSAIEEQLSVDLQEPKNHTGAPNSPILYLASSGSAVRLLCPHLSSTSCKGFQCCHGSMETNTGSLQSRAQISPPVPPKRSSSSPKFEPASLSPSPLPEVHLYPNTPTQLLWPARTQTEEEEGAEEQVPPWRTPGSPNAAAMLELKDWFPMVHSQETPPIGCAHSQPRLDRHQGNALTSGPSSTAPQSEGTGESHHDAMPPPPPPKKHHRVCGRMNQPSSDLEKNTWNDCVEHFAQPLKILPGGLNSTSSDGPASIPRILSDGGAPCLPGLSLCLSPSLVWPHPDVLPSTSPDPPLQPPPLPEKRAVRRSISGQGGPNPRFPPSGSEGEACGPDMPCSSMTTSQLNLRCSTKSPERAQTPLGHAPTPHVPAQPLEPGNHLCRAVASPCSSSCSSPQLGPAHPGSSLHLQMLLSNADSREGVYSKLGGLYAESLRRLALKCEEHFTRSQRSPLRFDESNWSLFKLTCGRPCCDAADGVYYAASCASDPRSPYAVKICKSPTQDAKQGHLYGLSVQQSVPPHFNLQQDCGHFIARVPHRMLPLGEGHGPPCHGEQERVVVITREVPRQSAAGFVQQWALFHRAQPEVYERRVCFLLLQLCSGLAHLKEHGVAHGNLCLESLLLVPPAPRPGGGCPQARLPRLLLSGFAKAKRHSVEDPAADPLLQTDRSRLAPEILSASQHRKLDEFQTGILIYELLHQPNPFKARPELKERAYGFEDLPPIPSASLYSAGLQRLARLLLHPDPIQRIHIREAQRALQSLLWGPRRYLMDQQWDRAAEGPRHEGLLSWLDVKRALLMMKFAERSLEPEQSAELEDWLCCQYFSSANPTCLCHTADLLYSD